MLKDLGDIGITEAQIDLLNSAEKFCREKSSIETVRGLLENEAGYDKAVWQEIVALGWTAIAVPEEHDGVGLTLTEVVPVIEQTGRRLLATPLLTTTLAAQAIATGGTDAQKAAYLPKIAAGSVVTLALSESGGGWDHMAPQATAAAAKSGYALSGKKVFVMYGADAEAIIVSVLRDGAPSLVMVPTSDLPEGALRREGIIDETKRSYELDLSGVSVTESAFFADDAVPATLEHVHLTANLLSAAETIGASQACIDYTIEYLKTRKQFGKLIGSFQALKHPTVDAFVGYEQARSLLYAAAYSFYDQGAGEIAVRMAKASAVDALAFASDRAIQFHGGFGFTYDCDAQLYRRRAIFNGSQHGDPAWHRAKLADLLF